MNPPDQKWSRLVAAARSAQDTRDTAAPYGFATRVAALALGQQQAVSLLERFSLRALGLAGLLALVCVAANFSTLTSFFRDETAASATDDPVAEVLDLAS
jgi:peptidoglycan/LPS O-acetylase OafA/YrhL